MLDLQVFAPSPELARYVQYYMIGEIKDNLDLPEHHEIFPCNMSAIVLLEKPEMFQYYQDDNSLVYLPHISFTGQLTAKKIIRFNQEGRIIAVVFTVVGLYSLYGLQMNDISNNAVSCMEKIDDLKLRACRDMIFNSFTPENTLRLLEEYFLLYTGIGKNDLRDIDRIVHCIYSNNGNIDIDWLIEQANMSARTFERHFCEKVGVTPKLFTRIVRFSHAMKMLELKKGVFDIVVSCGYSDQAHFIKEVKFFAGKTPKNYYEGLAFVPGAFLNNSI